MLDTRSESHIHAHDQAGAGGFQESEIRRGEAAQTTPGLPELKEPFPPIAANPQPGDNRLRQAMASVDLLQALDDLDAEDPRPANDDQPAPRPGSLDEILLAELGPDASEDVPQASAAIDRQLLLSRIVKARDAILAEEQQAAKAAQALANRAPAAPVAAAPFEPLPQDEALGYDDPPDFDTDLAPEPHTSIRDVLTARRLALAVSVTALCIAAGWTLRSGSLPTFIGHIGAMAEMETNGEAQAAVASMAVPPTRPQPVEEAAPEPVQAVEPAPASAAPEELAVRMAPQGDTAAAADEQAIKERLIETRGQPPAEAEAVAVPAEPAPVAVTPVPVAEPQQVASASPATQIDAPPAPVPEQQPAQTPAANAPKPRDPAAVETAMANSFGLDELEPAQRAALKQKLVAGECPSSALASLLGRAPVVATRDLVNNLENGC